MRFLSEVISPKVPNWSPDSYTKAFFNIDSNSPKNSPSKVLTRYGPLRQIWYALCAITANFVVPYGPLRKIWLYAMGHCGGFGYALYVRYARSECLYAALFATFFDVFMPP